MRETHNPAITASPIGEGCALPCAWLPADTARPPGQYRHQQELLSLATEPCPGPLFGAMLGGFAGARPYRY
jgi:hypothetical protein